MIKWKVEWFNTSELQTGLNKLSSSGWEVFYISTDHIGVSQTRFLVVTKQEEKGKSQESTPKNLETPEENK